MGQFKRFKVVKNHQLYLFLFLFLLANLGSSEESSIETLCDRIRTANHQKNEDKRNQLIKQAESIIHIPCFLELTPRYYWAQNMSHIMVKLQFLNSASTSACSQVLSTKKDIGYDFFSVMLICFQSSNILRYHLHIKTYMPLNYHHSEWKTGHQNTIILESLKSPSPYFWKTLHQAKYVPSRKPKVWWKVLEKYRQNIGNFFYDLDTYEGEDDISAFVKQKKQVKQTALTQIYNPHSDRYFYCNQNNPFELGSWIY